MVAGGARPRPHPDSVHPDSDSRAASSSATAPDTSRDSQADPSAAGTVGARAIANGTRTEAPGRPEKRRRGFAALVPRAGRQLAPAPPAQVAAAAGGAIVQAARVGRLLTRSSWRIARQVVPGVEGVDRLGHVAVEQLARRSPRPGPRPRPSSPEEQRVIRLVQEADTDPAPLRTAMSELLERSADSDGDRGRDYLFGTIVSQLVPDEARILAALATGRSFAALDVVARPGGRKPSRVVLSNVSTVGAAAGISRPQSGSTYLTRLQGLGLVDVGPPSRKLDAQFTALESDPAISDARSGIESRKSGTAKLVRKTVLLSPLGREFWAACAPDAGRPPALRDDRAR